MQDLNEMLSAAILHSEHSLDKSEDEYRRERHDTLEGEIVSNLSHSLQTIAIRDRTMSPI